MSDERTPLKHHPQGSIQGNDDPSADESDSSGSVNSCFYPTKGPYRIVFLVFACLITFGSYFSYDCIAATSTYLQSDMGLSNLQIQAFYSIYSFPNTVLTLFGGLILDKYLGIKLGGIVMAGLIFVGQSVLALGASLRHYWLMMVGRAIFALGGENLGVAQNTYLAKVFAGGKVALAFGIALSVSRVGSSVNMSVEPVIASSYSLAYAFWFAALLCFMSFIVSFVCAGLYKYGEKRVKSMRFNPADAETLSLRDIKYFQMEVWLIFFICVLFYCAVFPFISIAPLFFQQRYGMSTQDAGFIVGLPYLVSAGASPVFGFVIDRFGLNPYMVLISNVGLAAIYLMFLVTTLPPIALMVLMGIIYSLLASSLWPLIAKCVEPKLQATAYGVMTAVQNSGLTIASLSVGALADAKGYSAALLLFEGFLGLGILMSVALIVVDLRKGRYLSKPSGRAYGLLEDAEVVATATATAAGALESGGASHHSKLFADSYEEDAALGPPKMVAKNAAALRASYFMKIGMRI